MADTAAHLVDRVFPIVPVRQWVLSFPFALRYRMAYDADLTTDILNVFIRALFGDLRRRARQLLGLISSQCGAVTFVQRFGDALNSNVHFHCVSIDGVYAAGDSGRPEFHALPAPENDEVVRLVDCISRRIKALLERRGIAEQPDREQADPLSEGDPEMAMLLAHSVRSRIAVGANRGRRIVRIGDQIDGDDIDPMESPRCAMVSGFSIHGNTCIDARDRLRLERLLRYCLRPAVCMERFRFAPGGISANLLSIARVTIRESRSSTRNPRSAGRTSKFKTPATVTSSARKFRKIFTGNGFRGGPSRQVDRQLQLVHGRRRVQR
jgi:hypothetical protein